MNFNPRKLLVVVGNPHSGKMRTLQYLFRRKQFYIFKQPIKLDASWKEKFIVVNARDPYSRTDEQLHRIKSVIQYHTASDTSFLINLNLVLDNSEFDIRKILSYFNQSAFEIHYFVLYSSWFDKRVISGENISQLKQLVENGSIYIFERLVTQSELRFNERVEELKEVIGKIFGVIVDSGE
ncbi:hypothetical protein ABIE50_000612 [Chitinophaga sp. OAE865]